MARSTKSNAVTTPPSTPAAERPQCGIVMPISAIDDCSEQHWSDVREIITEAIEGCGFSAALVSEADDVGIIQKRIVQNLYQNPIVVCDVSCKNPNVMFELGMRLAFDKPTVIVKDNVTNYSFDTSVIEHLVYPRTLRFGNIVDFKRKLSEKIKGTYERSTGDAQYTTFLKHFGQFSVASLETKEVSSDQYIIEQLAELRQLILTVRRESAENRAEVSAGAQVGNSTQYTPTFEKYFIHRTRTAMNKKMEENGGVLFPDDEDAIVDSVVENLRSNLKTNAPATVQRYERKIRAIYQKLLNEGD
jgi:hypothetical protein